MAVNPLQPAVPYSVSASNETADHSKQKEERQKLKDQSQFKSKVELKSSKPSDEHDEPKPEPEAIELTSQIIDSCKVIELLSHRPKYLKSPKNCFQTLKSPREKSQISDIKKINKSY